MKRFLEFDRQMDLLVAQKRIPEAIALMEQNRSRYPDQEYLLVCNILYCHREMGEYRRCLEFLEAEQERGFFCNFDWPGWDPVRGLPGYGRIHARNEELRTEHQKLAAPAWEVHLPEEYSEENEYPLLLLLHGDGNGCNIEFFRGQWWPDEALKAGWIVAYVQSSRVECYKGYGWTKDYEKSREEILKAYKEITGTYSADPSRVVLGGFSGGAMASLNVLANLTLPLRGIIALCPNETEDTGEDPLGRAAERGVKVVLLEGEKSGDVPYQRQLLETFAKVGIPCQYILNPGVGHTVPADMGERALAAVDFIV